MRPVFVLSLTFLLSAIIAISGVAGDSFLEDTLRQGVGVRAMGMGGAFTSVANDATALFYNPAGIQERGLQYVIENADYKAKAYTRADNYLLQMGSLVLADWHRRTLDGQQMDVSAYALGFGTDTRWGFTYKRVVSTSGIDGYSIDFGVLMNMGSTLTAGFLAQDLFKENLPIRTTLRAGLSTRLFENKLLISADESFYRSPDPRFIMHYGLEYAFTQELDLRLGWDDGKFTGGVGLFFPAGSVEYAIVTSDRLNEESVHQIAVCFGRKREIPPVPIQNDRSYRPRDAELRRLQQRFR